MMVPKLLIRSGLMVSALAFLLHLQLLAGQTAFVSDRDGNYEIYRSACSAQDINLGSDCFGSSAVNITSHPGADIRPRWSPDGTKLLFLSDRTGNQDIYVVNADGSGLLNLTNSDVDELSPQWSPNGSQILYQTYETSAHPDGAVYTMAAGGGSVRLLTDMGLAATAKWSPNGAHILLATISNSLYVVNADGASLQLLWDSPSYNYIEPQWSPDSTRILFSSAQDDGDQIYAVDLTGASATLGAGSAPKWTADGLRIVFELFQDGYEQTFISDANGANRTELSGAEERVTEIFLEEGGSLFGEPYPTIGDWDLQVAGSTSVTLRPRLENGGIVVANLAPIVTTVAPLSIVSAFGKSISDEELFFPKFDSAGKISKRLGATCVEIGGERAPIFAVTRTQVNFQMPSTSSIGPVSVVVIRNCDQFAEARSITATVTVEEAAPAFFLFPPYDSAGLIAARFNAGYAAVAPVDSELSDHYGPSRPAKPGDIILLFGTGWGPTSAALTTGQRAEGEAPLLPAANPMVSVGGIPLAASDVLYVGATPFQTGLYQLAIRVPTTVLPGPNEVVLTVYGKSTPTGPVVTIGAP